MPKSHIETHLSPPQKSEILDSGRFQGVAKVDGRIDGQPIFGHFFKTFVNFAGVPRVTKKSKIRNNDGNDLEVSLTHTRTHTLMCNSNLEAIRSFLKKVMGKVGWQNLCNFSPKIA